jgi:hypothetical protein
MSFLGNTPTSQSFTSTTERFNGDGSTTTFTMSRAVFTAGDIEVIVNNVQQDPFTAYTVNGTTTLTFTGAPSVGTGNILVTYRNYIVSVVVPAEGTVTNSTLAARSVTGDKIGLTAITGNLIASGVTITSPVLITPNIGTPSSGILSSCTVDGTNAVGYKNIPQSGAAKTTSYTLAVTDVGEFIEIGASGSIVVPNATFAAGDAVVIFNNTSGAITLTMSITTAYIGGTDSDKATISLATRGLCNVLFISGTVCVVTGNVT